MNIRLDIVDPSGSSRLVGPGDGPALEIAELVPREPWQIVQAARLQLGLNVAFLGCARDGRVRLECLDATGALHPDARWIDAGKGLNPGPSQEWQRLGWLGRATALIDSALENAALRRIGRPVQIRHNSISAVLRIPTDGGTVWFKQVPPLFSFEGRLCRWLEIVLVAPVPRVIAAGEAWLITAEIAENDSKPAGRAIETLADLQIRSIGLDTELMALGCPLRGLESVFPAAAALVRRTDLLDPSDCDALQAHLGRLDALCADLMEIKIPNTLVHGDLHAANARWTKNGWILFDWTDAALAHPFYDLSMAQRGLDQRERARLVAGFAERWKRVLPARDVGRALRLIPAIGALHQAESHRRMADGVDPQVWRVGVRQWVRGAIGAL